MLFKTFWNFINAYIDKIVIYRTFFADRKWNKWKWILNEIQIKIKMNEKFQNYANY